jgi:hypothetical protein
MKTDSKHRLVQLRQRQKERHCRTFPGQTCGERSDGSVAFMADSDSPPLVMGAGRFERLRETKQKKETSLSQAIFLVSAFLSLFFLFFL